MMKMMMNLKVDPSRTALVVLSGLLIFLSFPEYGSGIFAWAALIPLFFALQGVLPREGFKIGFLAGFTAHVGILYWIAYVVVQHGYLPFYVGIAAMLLLSAYLSLYTAFFAFAIVFLRGKGIPLFLSAPSVWTLLDFARSHLLTGFPWEHLAHSQYLYGKVIQVGDITGTYGITFAIVLINVVLYDLFSRESRRSHLIAESVAACFVIAVIITYGHVRSETIGELLEKNRSLEVTLVQGNIDQNLKWNSRYQLQTIAIYRSLSLQSALSPGGLIVWPETAVPLYFQQPSMMQAAVVDIAANSRSALLFGSPSYEGEVKNISYMNSAFLLGPDGTVSGRYDKVHLVPYGEYVPLTGFSPSSTSSWLGSAISSRAGLLSPHHR
ncbi:MAG: apolipoprotein N-acyltransferase [Proteobacteria bacterium]|nr:apolipoprotein N-acyltransferase [Pseudomonadota bacterium]